MHYNLITIFMPRSFLFEFSFVGDLNGNVVIDIKPFQKSLLGEVGTCSGSFRFPSWCLLPVRISRWVCCAMSTAFASPMGITLKHKKIFQRRLTSIFSECGPRHRVSNAIPMQPGILMPKEIEIVLQIIPWPSNRTIWMKDNLSKHASMGELCPNKPTFDLVLGVAYHKLPCLKSLCVAQQKGRLRYMAMFITQS